MRFSDAPWPAVRQLDGDPLGLGHAAQSKKTKEWISRNKDAKIVKSICPYCAVGCGQRISVVNDEIVQIEGDPESPISRGHLCPKGSATRSYVQSPLREYKMKESVNAIACRPLFHQRGNIGNHVIGFGRCHSSSTARIDAWSPVRPSDSP